MSLVQKTVHGGINSLGDVYAQGLSGFYGNLASLGDTLYVGGETTLNNKITQNAGGMEMNDGTSQMTYSNGIFRLSMVGGVNLLRYTDTDGLALTGDKARLGIRVANPNAPMEILAKTTEDVIFRAKSDHPLNVFDFIIRHDLASDFSTPAYEIGGTGDDGTTLVSGMRIYRGGFGGTGAVDIFISDSLTAMTFGSDGRIYVNRPSHTNNNPNMYLDVAAQGASEGFKLRLSNSNTSVIAGGTAGELEFYKSDTSGSGAGKVSVIKSVAIDAGATYELEFHTGTAISGTTARRLQLGVNQHIFYGGSWASVHVNATLGNSSIYIASSGGTYDSSLIFRHGTTTKVFTGFDLSANSYKIVSGTSFVTTAALEVDLSNNDVTLESLSGTGIRMVVAGAAGKLFTQAIPGASGANTVYRDAVIYASGDDTVTPTTVTEFIYVDLEVSDPTEIIYDYRIDLDAVESSGQSKWIRAWVNLDAEFAGDCNLRIWIRDSSNVTIWNKQTGDGDSPEIWELQLFWNSGTSTWRLYSALARPTFP